MRDHNRDTPCLVEVHICINTWRLSTRALNHAVRCFVIARAPCLLLSPPFPSPHRVRSVCGCLFRVFILGSRTDVASRDWIARAGLASCVLAQLVVVGAESRCTLLCDRSCAVLAPVTPPPLLIAFDRFVGFGCGVSSRDWISTNFVPDCRLHM